MQVAPLTWPARRRAEPYDDGRGARLRVEVFLAPPSISTSRSMRWLRSSLRLSDIPRERAWLLRTVPVLLGGDG